MRKTLMLFIALFMLVLPVMAQEDDESTCTDVDLTDLRAFIDEIEMLLADGDTTAAGDVIEAAMMELYDLQVACVPQTTSTFTTEDGTVSIEYPAELIYVEDYGTYVFGTSQAAIDKFDSSSPVFEEGEYGFGLLLTNELFFSEDGAPQTVEEAVNGLKSIIIEENEGFSAGEVEFHGYSDLPGAIFDFEGPEFAGTIIIIMVADEQFIALVSGTHPTEQGDVRAKMEAVAESLRYQP